jgi:predicted AlkP superfamily phosphohydrolase/phosphomutase
LDCAPPQLVFDRWLSHLPNLRGLAEGGRHGVLRSCDPPITVPAWSVMTSSRNPGSLGIYGFRNRLDYSYERLALADSRAVRAPRVWEIVSAYDRPVVVIGVPGTYPPKRVNGVMISCFLTPDVKTSCYTYPPQLASEIEQVVGEYMVDVENFRTTDKRRLLTEIETMTARRFALAEHLIEARPWDLFFMVEMGTDRIQHGFWRYLDAEHRLHEPGSEYESAILDYYRALDAKIGRLLAHVPEDTTVMVVSDHGAQRMDGGIRVNEWLRREGYLTLRCEPRGPTPLTPQMVDWPRTIAWGEGGYYCRLFLNVAGREPAGVVGPDDYAGVREEIRAKLMALGDEQGRPIGTVAHRPEDIYPRGAVNVVPDLLVYFGNLAWRSLGSVGGAGVHALINDTGPDDANHAHEGIYLLAGPGVRVGAGGERDIRDVAPTILEAMGHPVPSTMEGASIV